MVPSELIPTRMVEGVGHGSIPASIPAASDAHSAFDDFGVVVEFLRGFTPLLPPGLQGFKTFCLPDTVFQKLARTRFLSLAQGIFQSEFELVDARLLCQGIHQCFMSDGRLGDTKAAERTGGRSIGQQGSCFCKNVRDEIGTAAVNRNPVRNGGAPGGIGSGIEISFER